MVLETSISLKRTRSNNYNGMLVAIAQPQGWQREQLLMMHVVFDVFSTSNMLSLVFVDPGRFLIAARSVTLLANFDCHSFGRVCVLFVQRRALNFLFLDHSVACSMTYVDWKGKIVIRWSWLLVVLVQF